MEKFYCKCCHLCLYFEYYHLELLYNLLYGKSHLAPSRA
uniref:Uncharacterized protein n=1 Tax=Setaria italica TaxID=4555 RepID=K3XU69_SETIT